MAQAHPSENSPKANLAFARAAALTALAVAVCGGAFALDPAWTHWVLTHQHRSVAHWAGRLSHYGDWPGLMALGTAALVWAYLRRAQRLLHLLLCMLLASTIAGASVNLGRLAAGRARPNARGVTPGWYGLWHGQTFLLHKNKYHSFPSGHTAGAFAFFGTLAWARRRWAWLFLVPAGVIGCSRLYLNAHHLSDVVVAALLGLLISRVVWTRAGPWLRRRLNAAVTKAQGQSRNAENQPLGDVPTGRGVPPA